MEIFNIGPLEFIIIVVLMFIILGPKDMIKTMQSIGRWVRSMTHSQMWREVWGISQEIRELPKKMMDETGLEEAMAEVQKTTREVTDELNAQIKEAKEAATVTELEHLTIDPEKPLPPPAHAVPAALPDLPGVLAVGKKTETAQPEIVESAETEVAEATEIAEAETTGESEAAEIAKAEAVAENTAVAGSTAEAENAADAADSETAPLPEAEPPVKVRKPRKKKDDEVSVIVEPPALEPEASVSAAAEPVEPPAPEKVRKPRKKKEDGVSVVVEPPALAPEAQPIEPAAVDAASDLPSAVELPQALEQPAPKRPRRKKLVDPALPETQAVAEAEAETVEAAVRPPEEPASTPDAAETPAPEPTGSAAAGGNGAKPARARKPRQSAPEPDPQPAESQPADASSGDAG